MTPFLLQYCKKQCLKGKQSKRDTEKIKFLPHNHAGGKSGEGPEVNKGLQWQEMCTAEGHFTQNDQNSNMNNFVACCGKKGNNCIMNSLSTTMFK